MDTDRRKLSRRNFSYYMKVSDQSDGKLVGHISDISVNGFKVDSNHPVPLNTDFRLSIDQLGDITSKATLVFKARSMWCRMDPFDPTLYNVGFKIVEMTPGDHEIFLKMFEAYGAHKSG